jgi:CheY-like chemotaxis protein
MFGHLRVLVIEDIPIHMILLKEQLVSEMNIPIQNVTCVFDGNDAVSLIKQNIERHKVDPNEPLFSLIITDYHVPGACGIEILVSVEKWCNEIQKNRPKVIMLTAVDDPELKRALQK